MVDEITNKTGLKDNNQCEDISHMKKSFGFLLC